MNLSREILQSLQTYIEDDDPVKLLTGINPILFDHPNKRLIVRRITEFLPEKQKMLWQRIYDNRDLNELHENEAVGNENRAIHQV